MMPSSELIDALIAAIEARSGKADSLFLPGWNHDCWQRLLVDAQVMRLGNGDVLLKRDDPSNDLYFLVEGELEVSVPKSDSMTMTAVVSRGPGSIVGEIAFLDAGPRTASVWSLGVSVLLRLPEAAFEDFRATEPALAGDLLYAIGRILAHRLRQCIGSPVTHGRLGSSSGLGW
jgi:CRP/FNR family transcriptional regulator, cyclic AMP receptor protein